MKAPWGCLCLWILYTIVCEASDVFKKEEEKIESPENCTFSTRSYGFIHFLSCPDLFMHMETFLNRKNGQELVHEYRSIIDCSPHFLPYKYLPDMKSNRNSLVFKNCQLPEHGSFGEGWPRLEFLNFENYGDIGPLKREHFSGLDNLRNLKLFINSSHEMPDDLFSGSTKLKDIAMYVKNGNKNVFRNLTELESLRLTIASRESLNNFDTSEMKNLPTFTNFQLYSNHFTRLTKRFFEGCANVESVQLNTNTFDAIDADAFEPMTNLKTMKMAFNKLTSLPAGLFSQNLELEKIEILFSKNLTSIPSGLFSNLPNLREIHLNCKLTSVPSDLIRGSTNLVLLDLRFNELPSLPTDLLQNHSKLEIVKLGGNKFDSTSSDLFDDISPATEVSFA